MFLFLLGGCYLLGFQFLRNNFIMESKEDRTEMKLHMYFKQHSVYFTKEKRPSRAVLDHADKDTDRNTNFFLYI